MSYTDILKTLNLSDSPRRVFLVQQPDMSPFSVGTSVSLCVYLKVTEDGDVGKFFAISMRIEGQQECPLQTHEAPHTRQVQTGRICEGCRHTHTQLKRKWNFQTTVLLWVECPEGHFLFKTFHLRLIWIKFTPKSYKYKDFHVLQYGSLLTFLVGGGNTEEGDERYDGDHGENYACDEEELQSL